jgi:hypothetical protein
MSSATGFSKSGGGLPLLRETSISWNATSTSVRLIEARIFLMALAAETAT